MTTKISKILLFFSVLTLVFLASSLQVRGQVTNPAALQSFKVKFDTAFSLWKSDPKLSDPMNYQSTYGTNSNIDPNIDLVALMLTDNNFMNIPLSSAVDALLKADLGAQLPKSIGEHTFYSLNTEINALLSSISSSSSSSSSTSGGGGTVPSGGSVVVNPTTSLNCTATTKFCLFGKDIGCDPAIPPNEPGGCGFTEFLQVMRAFIFLLVKIAIPLAAVFIVWGGLVIMMAAGSTEKVAEGRKIITAAVVGLTITLGAWLIIATIFIILPLGGDLNLGEQIKQALFGNRLNP